MSAVANPKTARIDALMRELADMYEADAVIVDEALERWSGRVGPPYQTKAVPHVYFVMPVCEGLDVIKIGWTHDTTRKRLKALQCGSPTKLVSIYTFEGSQTLERFMHRRFAEWRSTGEWFYIDGDLSLFMTQCAHALVSRKMQRA